MSTSRKSLIKPRSKAFNKQQGNCYYCNQPMWLNEPEKFSLKYNITLKQARRFQCTGEHLTAHKDGGTAKQENIVAACCYCNLQRHKRSTAPTPQQYKKFIERRMNKGRWHIVRLASNSSTQFYPTKSQR